MLCMRALSAKHIAEEKKFYFEYKLIKKSILNFKSIFVLNFILIFF